MDDRKDKKKQNSKSSKKMEKDYGMFGESDIKIDMSNENLKLDDSILLSILERKFLLSLRIIKFSQ